MYVCEVMYVCKDPHRLRPCEKSGDKQGEKATGEAQQW